MGVISSIRERVPQVRVRATLVAETSHGEPPARVRFGRSLAIMATLAAFVSLSGAFGTSGISPGLRLVVLELAALAVVLADLVCNLVLDRAPWAKAHPGLRFAAVSPAVLAGGVAFSWALAVLLEGSRRTPDIARFVPPALICFAAVTSIAWLVKRPIAPKPQPLPADPEFVVRLPHRLRGATILAVQGEDHYVRIHTSHGQHMLLMRLSDALDQLVVLDGAQTHRSWWVARRAVTDVKRAHGRAALTLANGVEAPVSRRFSRLLRAQGWY
jgi:hypothetical protein